MFTNRSLREHTDNPAFKALRSHLRFVGHPPATVSGYHDAEADRAGAGVTPMTLLDANIKRDPVLGEDTWDLFEAIECSFGIEFLRI